MQSERSIRTIIYGDYPNSLFILTEDGTDVRVSVCSRNFFEENQNDLIFGSFKSPGVYILAGDEQRKSTPAVYIGESQTPLEQISQHLRDLPFIQQIYFCTKTTEHLKDSQRRLIEEKLIARSIENIYHISKNRKAVTSDKNKRFSDLDDIPAHKFIQQLVPVLLVSGIAVFDEEEPQRDFEHQITKAENNTQEETELEIEQVFEIRHERANKPGKSVNATGHYTTGNKFMVKAGSIAAGILTNSFRTTPSLLRKHNFLTSTKVLIKRGDCYEFTQNHEFSSPSMAAGICLGYPNGNCWQSRELQVRSRGEREAGRSYDARGYYTTGKKFMVRAESIAAGTLIDSFRNQPYLMEENRFLTRNGILVKQGDNYVFTQDHEFSSASRAASVCTGSRTSSTMWQPFKKPAESTSRKPRVTQEGGRELQLTAVRAEEPGKFANANGYYTADHKLTVRAGSIAAGTLTDSFRNTPSLLKEHNLLTITEVLVKRGDSYEFTKNYTFNSPTMAASICLGRKANGLKSWKDDFGQPLGKLDQ